MLNLYAKRCGMLFVVDRKNFETNYLPSLRTMKTYFICVHITACLSPSISTWRSWNLHWARKWFHCLVCVSSSLFESTIDVFLVFLTCNQIHFLWWVTHVLAHAPFCTSLFTLLYTLNKSYKSNHPGVMFFVLHMYCVHYWEMRSDNKAYVSCFMKKMIQLSSWTQCSIVCINQFQGMQTKKGKEREKYRHTGVMFVTLLCPFETSIC